MTSAISSNMRRAQWNIGIPIDTSHWFKLKVQGIDSTSGLHYEVELRFQSQPFKWRSKRHILGCGHFGYGFINYESDIGIICQRFFNHNPDRWTSSTHRLSNLLGSLSALCLGSFDSVEFAYWYSLQYRPFIILYDPYSGRHIICHILYVTYIKHFFDSKLPICDFWIVFWNSLVY